MFTTSIHETKVRQAELIREANKERLIRSLPKKKSLRGDIPAMVRGLISLSLLP